MLPLSACLNRRERSRAFTWPSARHSSLVPRHSSAFTVDQAIKPSTVYGPIDSTSSAQAADLFAKAIVASRSTSPFISTSQLNQLKAVDKNNALSPFFGNPDQWKNSDGPTEWNVAASEQYFAKIFNFATVRSRNFRVFVTGQVFVPANGAKAERIISTANKVYEIFLKPGRDASGAITSQASQVTYAADLPF